LVHRLGSGRGAGFKKENDNEDDGGPMGFDSFGGYNENLFGSTPYDDDDEEADKIYNAIDERMNASKKRKTLDGTGDQAGNGNETMSKIGDQFRDLKEKLAEVTEEEWAAIPAVADYRFVVYTFAIVLFVLTIHAYF
jgi:pre-mRNA-processing factor 6